MPTPRWASWPSRLLTTSASVFGVARTATAMSISLAIAPRPGGSGAGGDDDGLGPERLGQLQHLTLRGGVGAELVDAIGQQRRSAPCAARTAAISSAESRSSSGLAIVRPSAWPRCAFDEVDDQRVGAHDRVEEAEALGPDRQLPPGETVVADQRARPPGDAFERIGRRARTPLGPGRRAARAPGRRPGARASRPGCRRARSRR